MNIIINIFSMIFDSLIISSVLVGFMGIYYTKFVKKLYHQSLTIDIH